MQNYAPTAQIAPKEKSELEKAKDEAARRAAAKAADEEDGNEPGQKKKKQVGFAATAQGGFGASTGSEV